VSSDDRASETEARPRVRVRGRVAFPLAASAFAHVVLLSVAGAVAYHSLAGREAERPLPAEGAPRIITIELPPFSEGVLLAEHELVPVGEPPEAHGGATVARVDDGARGRGGERAGARATNLAAVDDGLSLSPDLVSHLDREQHQRLRTARLRKTWEDRRATKSPMELTFLATGTGPHEERRPSSVVDPSRGSLVAHRASVRGGAPGVRGDDLDQGAEGAARGAARAGALAASPGLGLRRGTPGTDHRAAARIALGRPSVTEGPVTIPATTRGRPHDTVDSDQEVASTVRALVHASVAGGVGGRGRGGTPAPLPDPGAGGGSGRGSASRVLGTGDGDVFDWQTDDPMLLPYFRKLHAKVDPLWRDAFPRSAMLELKQGTVILEFTVESDGSAVVRWPPVRPSGIDEFDRNCADAIRRASPFEPIPKVLRDQGRTKLRIRAPFVAKNPIIK
jgi:TonB family protein